MKLKKSDKVKIKGTDTSATISRVGRDGVCTVILDCPPGVKLRIHATCLLLSGDEASSTTTASSTSTASPTTPAPPTSPAPPTTPAPPTSPATPTSTAPVPVASAAGHSPSTQIRDHDGKFLPGGSHPNYNVKDRSDSRNATVRSLRRELTLGMAPLVSKLPAIISQIDEPEKQAAAINKTLSIIMPSYANIKYSDTPDRSLTAEQDLAKRKEEFLKSQRQ